MTDLTTHKSSRRRLQIALMLTCTFMVIQLLGAYFSNSLAVLADASHLFVHNSSLFIALIASYLAVKIAHNYSDGFRRAELTGGLINAILYLLISGIILWEGGERLFAHQHGDHHEVNTFLMSTISGVGFLFHTAAAFVLYKGRNESINVYAVFLHTFFDVLSTVITFVSGVAIHYTGWAVIDVMSSMLITLFVLYTGIKLLYGCVTGLLKSDQRIPPIGRIESIIKTVEHIGSVHNLYVKNADGKVYFGAHIVLKGTCTKEKHDELCRYEVETLLKERFNIEHSVLQIEAAPTNGSEQCNAQHH
ncbi:cation diffusion facilitator family transporter [Flocculibacter collagenilyticus]|uniref:cation diffusion facilitator family transporter n=1 Tax=Flocculibacter collagenilyticus TaxID=2744479 RepID=UPI0018F6C199|nr:cation diffusion facilitator family transporter [Flocculibacter collagenilyticus]